MGRRPHSLRWITGKFVLAGLVIGLVLGACATVLLLQDPDNFDATRHAALRSIQAERAQVQTALGQVHHKLEKITADIATEQTRIRRTAEVMAQLKALDSTWDKLMGDAQQKANSEREAKLEQQQLDAMARVAAWQADYTRTGWERDGREIELAKLERQLKAEEEQSKMGHYLRRAWRFQIGWMKVSGWIGVLLSLLLFGLAIFSLALDRAGGSSRRPEP